MYRIRKATEGLTAAITMLAAALGLIGALLLGAAPAHAQQTTVICTQTHIVQRGETLYRIARQYGTTTAALQAMNGITNANRIYAGQSLCVAQQISGTTYVVQPGDTLARIARRFGVDMTVLARINGISNPNRIYAGQTLIIPDVTIQG
jgi:LysM repeat protein